MHSSLKGQMLRSASQPGTGLSNVTLGKKPEVKWEDTAWLLVKF